MNLICLSPYINQTQNFFFVTLFSQMPFEGTAIKSLTDRCVQDVLLKQIYYRYRVNSPNTGCLPTIGNGPQSGPPLYSKAEGRFAALHFIIGRRAAKRPISFQCGQRPQIGSALCREAKIRYLVSIQNLANLPQQANKLSTGQKVIKSQ